MINDTQMSISVVTEESSAVKPQTAVHGETEGAIKLLCIEIMDAYGLCRPAAHDECSTKRS